MAANVLLRILSDPGNTERDLREVGKEMAKLGKERVQATVDVATERAQGKVKGLRDQLTQLNRTTANPNIDLQEKGVRAQIAQVEARLANLAKQESSPTVDVKIGKAAAQLDRLQVRLAKLDAQRVDVEADVDTSRASAALDRLNVALGNVNTDAQFLRNIVSLIKLPALMVAAGLAAQAVGALGGAVAGLAGALGPAVGGLGAYPVLLTAFAQAMGVAKLATAGLKDAAKPLSDALAAPSPYVKQLAGVLKDEFAPQLTRLRNLAQRNMVPGLIDGARAAAPVLRTLRPVVAATGDVLGGLARRAGELVGSKAWRSDISAIGMRNVGIIRTLGRGAIYGADALRNVTVAAGPLTSWLAKSAAGFAKNVAAQAQAGRESGRLAAFFDRARTVIAQVARIGGNLAHVLFDIAKAAAPLGRHILGGLEDATITMRNFTSSGEGARKLRGYFNGLKPAVDEAGKLIVGLGKSLATLSGGSTLAPLLKSIRTELLPVLTDTIASTSKAFGPALIRSLTEVVKLFGTLAGSSGPLTLFVQFLGTLASGLNAVIKNVPGAKELVVALAGLAAVAKAVQFTGWITGVSKLIGLYKKLKVAEEGAAAASAVTGGIGGKGKKGATEAIEKGAAKGAAVEAGATAGGGFLASFVGKLKGLGSRIGGLLSRIPGVGRIGTVAGVAISTGLIGPLKSIGPKIGSALSSAAGRLGGIAKAGASAGRGLVTAIGGAVTRLPALLGRVFGGLAARLGPLLGRAFAGLGARLLPLLGRVFTLVVPRLIPVLGVALAGLFVLDKLGLLEPLKRFALSIINAIASGLRAAATAVVGAVRAVMNLALAALRTYVTLPFAIARQIFNAVAAGIRAVGPVITGAARAVITGALNAIRAVIGVAQAAGSAVFNAVRTGISSTVGAIVNLARSIARQAVAGVRAFVDTARSAGTAVFNAVKSGIRSVLAPIVELAKSIIRGAVAGVRAFVASAQAAGAAVFNAVKTGVTSTLGAVVNAGKAVVRGAVAGVRDFIGAAKDAGVAVFNAVKSGVSSLAGEVAGAARGVVRGAIDGARSIAGGAADLGRHLIMSMVNGVRNAASALGNAAADAVKNALKKARDLLPGSEPKDRTSPFRRLDRAGAGFVGNFQAGLTRALPALASDVDRMAAGLTAQLNANVSPSAALPTVVPVAAPVGGGDTYQSFNLPPAGGDGADANELLTQLAQRMRTRA